MNEMFQASACLALSAVAGWMTKWVLAGWLGIPRNCDLMRGEIPWFVIKLVAALLAAYILLTNLIYYFL